MFEREEIVEEALILIVDDTELNRDVLKGVLQKKGFRNIICVESGEAALVLVATDEPDCILLDVLMPGIDGFETCRRLRADKRFLRTPIIIQTALMGQEDRRRAFAAGASDIVSKPLDAAEIEARVRLHLSNSLLYRRLSSYHARVEAELQEARTLIEAAALPQAGMMVEAARFGVSLSQAYLPCSAIGGDFWKTWILNDKQMAILFVDVSGHGVSAALRMFAVNTLISPPPSCSADPAQMTAYLDQRLCDCGQAQGQYVAGIYGIIDIKRHIFCYVGGGLRDGFILRGDGGIDRVKMSGLPFGLVENLSRTPREASFGVGDTLLLYSDALVECAEPDGVPTSEEELHDWIQAQRKDAPKSGLAPWLAERFLTDFGVGIRDDLLIVSARIDQSADQVC
ncbi:phosphoserine phosphatase RsbU/P [Azospirillaceae bacterium]